MTMQSLPQTSKDQWAILAGTRFVLACVVMTGHIGLCVSIPSYIYKSPWDGFGAVLGFFAISGYSIAASVTKNADGFYARRAWRILPVYVFCWLLSLVPWILGGVSLTMPNGVAYEAPTFLQVFGNLFLLQGFATVVISSFGAAWSLSIECLYYAFAPWLAKQSGRVLVALIVCSAAAYLVMPNFGHSPTSYETCGFAALMLAWAWIGGFLYQRTPENDWHKGLVTALPLILLTLYTVSGKGNADSCITFSVAALALVYGRLIRLPSAAAKTLDYLGDLSYPLYLAHFPVLYLCAMHSITRPLAIWGITLVASAAILHFVDYPSRAYAKRRASRVLLVISDMPAPVTAESLSERCYTQ